MTLGQMITVVRHHWGFVLTLTVVLVATVAVWERSQVPLYRSSTLMQVQAPTDQSGIVSLQGTLSARERAVTIVALGNTRDVARRALASLRSAPGLQSCSFAQDGQSEYILATCIATRSRTAAAGADAYAAALQSVLAQQRQSRIVALRDLYAEQLAVLKAAGVPAANYPTPPVFPTFAEVQTIDRATPPSAPFSPQPLRTIVLAIVLALILNVGIAFALERVQNRARTPEELRSALNERVLAAIPTLRSRDDGGPTAINDILAPRRRAHAYAEREQ